MKQLFVCLLMLISVSVFSQDRVIAAKELPSNAKILIKETFNFQKVVQATMDTESRSTEYKFVLADNTKVECDAEGNWTEIESDNMPTSLIPEVVQNYCQKNYAGFKIHKIEKQKGNLKFELNNDVDLFYNTEKNTVSADK